TGNRLGAGEGKNRWHRGRRQPAPPHRGARDVAQRQRHLQVSPMSWSLITDDWRLKLTAVVLAVLMLGAVAFSQNPPTTKTLTVGLNYIVPSSSSTPSCPYNIVLINPPSKTNVTYSGLADVIANVNPS